MTAKEDISDLRCELGEWKARVEKVIRKFDKLSCEDKENVRPHLNDLNMIVAELSDSIEGLESKCPRKYNSYSGEWEFKFAGAETPKDDVLEAVNPT